MKLERRCCGLGLMLIVNYMIHHQYAPAVYFGVVLCALLIKYRQVHVGEMMEKTLIRFVILLGCALLFSVEILAVEGLSWFVLCMLSSCFMQRIQKNSTEFLENISCINIITLTCVFCGLALSSWTSWNPSYGIVWLCALFQPSGLALIKPLNSFVSKPISK